MRNEAETYLALDGHHHRVVEALDQAYRDRVAGDHEWLQEAIWRCLTPGQWMRPQDIHRIAGGTSRGFGAARKALVEMGLVSQIDYKQYIYIRRRKPTEPHLSGSCAREVSRLLDAGLSREQIAELMPPDARAWVLSPVQPARRNLPWRREAMLEAMVVGQDYTASQLAVMCGVSPGHAGNMLRHLEALGRVEQSGNTLRRQAALTWRRTT